LLPKPDRGRSATCEKGETALATPAMVLSLAVRSGPVATAVNGTPVARPVRTTWHILALSVVPDRRVRPVLGDQLPRRQAAKAARQLLLVPARAAG
jgi:hypothetical protein